MLTEEQKTQRLKCARELLKTYNGCKSRVISNLLTGDETWVHMFKPQRRADNKQWKRKHQKRPCIAKRTISSKKMLYTIFFNSSGPVIQVPCPSGHTVTDRFYKNSVLKKVKELLWYNKKRPSNVSFRGNYIKKKVRVVSLARDTLSGPYLCLYQILSIYFKPLRTYSVQKNSA